MHEHSTRRIDSSAWRSAGEELQRGVDPDVLRELGYPVDDILSGDHEHPGVSRSYEEAAAKGLAAARAKLKEVQERRDVEE